MVSEKDKRLGLEEQLDSTHELVVAQGGLNV